MFNNTPTTSTPDAIAAPRHRRSKRHVRAVAVALAAVAAVGVTAQQVNRSDDGGHDAMTAIPTMCDGFADCIYTAYWYAFLR
jgi:hypothetical protein